MLERRANIYQHVYWWSFCQFCLTSYNFATQLYICAGCLLAVYEELPFATFFPTHRPFPATMSQLKICDFFQDRHFKGFWSTIIFYLVQRRHNCSPPASFANCVMTLYLLKSASANVSFYTNNSKKRKCQILSWRHSCRKWVLGTYYAGQRNTRQNLEKPLQCHIHSQWVQ